TDTAGAAAAGRGEGHSGVEPSPAVMLVAPDAYVRNEAVSRAKIRVDWGSGVTFGTMVQPTHPEARIHPGNDDAIRTVEDRAGNGRSGADGGGDGAQGGGPVVVRVGDHELSERVAVE